MTIPSADVLVNQCINGDTTAYRLLYERYNRAMFNTALRITGNRSDAEDILQESFADAFFELQSFEQKASFGTWLKQIVVYKCIALLKKQRIKLVELDDEPEQTEETAYDETETAFSVELIKKALQSMPHGYRTVLSLYLLEGYDQEEIASILQVAPSTVRTQYIRGKQKLLQLLKRRAHE